MLPKKYLESKDFENCLKIYEFVQWQGEYSENLLQIQMNIYKKISELNEKLTFKDIEYIYNNKLMLSVQKTYLNTKRRYVCSLFLNKNEINSI